MPIHTSKIFLRKSIWNEVSDKVKKLTITQNKNIGSLSPHSPATPSPASHKTQIDTKPVINSHIKVDKTEKPSEAPSDDPTTEDLDQDPLLALVPDSLSQPEISNSSDIAQLLSVSKSTTHKDSKCTAKVHRRYVFARAKKEVTQHANGGLTRSDMHVLQETSCKINIVGINDHELTALPIATTSMVFQPNQGPIVCIVHEYVHLRQELNSCLWSA